MSTARRQRRKRRYEDLRGQRFGRWTVTSLIGRCGRSDRLWRVRCACGQRGHRWGADLRRSASTGCPSCRTKSYFARDVLEVLFSFTDAGWGRPIAPEDFAGWWVVHHGSAEGSGQRAWDRLKRRLRLYLDGLDLVDFPPVDSYRGEERQVGIRFRPAKARAWAEGFLAGEVA